MTASSLEHAERHIHALYEVSKHLTRFESVERTLPRILELVAENLPLRTAVVIEEREGHIQSWGWCHGGVAEEELGAAKARAHDAYDYLVGRGSGPTPPGAPASAAAEEEVKPVPGQVVALPLVVERRPPFGLLQLGALVMEPSRSLDRVDAAFINAVANQLAIALDRRAGWEALVHREELGREHAEARQAEADTGERRQRLLSETSALLAAPLDYGANIEKLARRIVPVLGDCCVITLAAVDEHGFALPATTVVAHADAEWEALCCELVRRFPPPPEARHGPGFVMCTGRAEVRPDLRAAGWAAGAPEDAFTQLLRQLGAASYACVPLLARGKPIGAMTLVVCSASRRHDAADVALAEDVAWRAAAAIDNARLYEQARRAVHARDELLAVVSHDLRNPLNSIMMGAAVLLRSLPAEESRRHERRGLENIGRAVGRMKRLITDLLDIGAIEAGRLTLQTQRYSADALVGEVVEALQPAAAEKSVRLEQELPAGSFDVVCDRDRMLQVLSNLTDNALKFTPMGGSIRVRAEARGGEGWFEVIDTGPGIPPDDVPRVFDRYWQAGGKSRGGVGLGLAIAKAIVESHGGRIGLESRVGEGTTFFFVLPVAPAAQG